MTKEIIENDPYKLAGVDITAGNDLVDKIKNDVASSHNQNVMESKVKYPHSISRTCLAQEFGLVLGLLDIIFVLTTKLETFLFRPMTSLDSLSSWDDSLTDGVDL